MMRKKVIIFGLVPLLLSVKTYSVKASQYQTYNPSDVNTKLSNLGQSIQQLSEGQKQLTKRVDALEGKAQNSGEIKAQNKIKNSGKSSPDAFKNTNINDNSEVTNNPNLQRSPNTLITGGENNSTIGNAQNQIINTEPPHLTPQGQLQSKIVQEKTINAVKNITPTNINNVKQQLISDLTNKATASNNSQEKDKYNKIIQTIQQINDPKTLKNYVEHNINPQSHEGQTDTSIMPGSSTMDIKNIQNENAQLRNDITRLQSELSECQNKLTDCNKTCSINSTQTDSLVPQIQSNTFSFEDENNIDNPEQMEMDNETEQFQFDTDMNTEDPNQFLDNNTYIDNNANNNIDQNQDLNNDPIAVVVNPDDNINDMTFDNGTTQMNENDELSNENDVDPNNFDSYGEYTPQDENENFTGENFTIEGTDFNFENNDDQYYDNNADFQIDGYNTDNTFELNNEETE